MRFFTSAFETAWAPFYYATSRQPDAKQTFGKMTTYGVAVLVLLVAGTTAVARDVILAMLKPEYLAALPVVPTIAVGIALQGVYLLTSIGLNLTSRTEFYPVSTLTAAGVGFAVGLALIPHYGVVGAALTVLVSYLTQLRRRVRRSRSASIRSSTRSDACRGSSSPVPRRRSRRCGSCRRCRRSPG